jgi:hypothetical protein
MDIPVEKVYRRPMGPQSGWSTNDFLNALMHRCGVKTDYGLHKLLAVSRQTIYRYRAGGTFDDAIALRVAKLLDVDPALMLVYVARDRARHGEAKKLWEVLAKKLARAAVLVALVHFAWMGLPGLPDALQQVTHAQPTDSFTYYAQLAIALVLAAVAALRRLGRYPSTPKIVLGRFNASELAP